MDDRRSNGRTRTSKAGSLFFGRQTGEHACNVEVKDVGNGGAGIYKSGSAILPLTFELSFDNLRRRCRMVWRRGNFFGVTFEDQPSPMADGPEVGEAEVVIEEPTLSILGDPLALARPNDDQVPSEFVSKIAERSGDSRSDVRFTIGVVVALALPVLISLGAYVATTVVLRAG
jgi:hypothetical protein